MTTTKDAPTIPELQEVLRDFARVAAGIEAFIDPAKLERVEGGGKGWHLNTARRKAKGAMEAVRTQEWSPTSIRQYDDDGNEVPIPDPEVVLATALFENLGEGIEVARILTGACFVAEFLKSPVDHGSLVNFADTMIQWRKRLTELRDRMIDTF